MKGKNLVALKERFANEVCEDIDPFPVKVRDAFQRTSREKYLGPGPWKILTRDGYVETANSDLTHVYQPAAIALDANRGINNGEPQLHARMLAAADPQQGDSVVHVGAGTGYYTAILADLVGPSGFVTAYEIVDSIGKMALSNLQHLKNVDVHLVSGNESIPSADVIYVCAGATRPMEAWLYRLKPGGRLVFPLTPNRGFGGVLRVARRGEEKVVLDARFVSPTMFITCQGARRESEGEALTLAFRDKDVLDVRTLHRRGPTDDTCWFRWSDELWLSTKAVD